MSSSKSKKKRKKVKSNLLCIVRDELERKGIPGGPKIAATPPGVEKMSEVLIWFVEPYAPYVRTEKDWKTLYAVAALAWNLALLPENERRAFDDAIHEEISSDGDAARWVIDELVHRKKQYFDGYSRLILNHKVQIKENRVDVSVTSQML